MEIWKDIVGYEGSYQVSNYGRIRSIDRVDSIGRKLKGKVLIQKYTRANYKTVGLSKNGTLHSYRVNRIVAIAFINNPNNCPQVGHINDDKNNNSVDNLYWTTQKENNMHNNKHIRVGEMVGKPIIGIKGKEKLLYKSSLDAGRNGFNASAIRNCLTGRTSKHKGFQWFYAGLFNSNGE